MPTPNMQLCWGPYRTLLVLSKAVGLWRGAVLAHTKCEPSVVLYLCSELLYPDGSTSPTSGADAEVLRNGRDYVVSWFHVSLYTCWWRCCLQLIQLWKFTQARFVVRKEISSVVKVFQLMFVYGWILCVFSSLSPSCPLMIWKIF